MKTIVIKTQAELDALPDSFAEFTVIEIRSDPAVWIQVNKTSDSSRVEAWGSSRVEAWGSSRVVARDSSRVVALDSSSVEAWDSSRVEAYNSSRVEAWGSSRVEAWDSSSVEAWGSSRVVARDSSRVVAWDSSSVEAFQFATLIVLSTSVLLPQLCDRVVCRLRGVDIKPGKVDKTVKVLKEPGEIKISFETWLERGYVVADGIHSKLVSRKRKGNVEIFTVQKDFLSDKNSYVVKRGDLFSHGDAVEKAIEDLRYKISSRDTSRFKKWKLETKISVEDGIQAYRAITGACEFGVKHFMEGVKIPRGLTVGKVIELTRGQYGSDQFERFFK